MKKLLLFILLIPINALWSGFMPEAIKINLGTPRDAIITHYKYLTDDNYHPEVSVKALNLIRMSEEDAEESAIKLKKIFDGKGLVINFNKLPIDSNFIDSSSGRNIYIPFANYPEIYLEKVGNKWKYSRFTIDAIPGLYRKVFPVQLSNFIDELPNYMHKTYLGLYLWQWAGMVLLAITGFLISRILLLILRLISNQILCRTRLKESVNDYLKPNLKIISTLAAIIMLYEFIPVLELPVKLFFYIDKFFLILIPVSVTIIVFRFSDYLSNKVNHFARKNWNKKHGENLIPFLRTTLKVFVIIFGLLAVLLSLGIDILPYLAGLSIGGIAIALAAQETIKNIFGSITVFSDRPFDVGDWIVFPGGEGEVEEIGVRSSRVRTPINSLITVPNGKLSDMTIDNLGRRQYRRFLTNIDIRYDTPLADIERFINTLRKLVEDSPDTRKDKYYIYLNNLSSSGCQILFHIFFEVPDFDAELKARETMLFEIIRLAEELNIIFAQPIQRVFLNNEDRG